MRDRYTCVYQGKGGELPNLPPINIAVDELSPTNEVARICAVDCIVWVGTGDRFLAAVRATWVRRQFALSLGRQLAGHPMPPSAWAALREWAEGYDRDAAAA